MPLLLALGKGGKKEGKGGGVGGGGGGGAGGGKGGGDTSASIGGGTGGDMGLRTRREGVLAQVVGTQQQQQQHSSSNSGGPSSSIRSREYRSSSRDSRSSTLHGMYSSNPGSGYLVDQGALGVAVVHPAGSPVVPPHLSASTLSRLGHVPPPSPQSSSQSSQQPLALLRQVAVDSGGAGVGGAGTRGANSIVLRELELRVQALEVLVLGMLELVVLAREVQIMSSRSLHQQEPQQHQPQLSVLQQMLPLVSGLWTLGLPSSSPDHSLPPTAHGLPPPNSSPAVVSPPSSQPTPPVVPHSCVRPCPPRLHSPSHVDDLHTVLLCSTSLITDPRASPSYVLALVAVVGDFVTTRRLDNATRVVATPPTRPVSAGEAEIYASAMAAQELCWLTFLLTSLGERPSFAPTSPDNKAMCREPQLESRLKNINVIYFLLRELQRCGQARLDFVDSAANTADIFTQAFPPGNHHRFRPQLGLCFSCFCLCFYYGIVATPAVSAGGAGASATATGDVCLIFASW
ncbi:unnamed protein product [Closterium sp. NIES-54]